MDTVGGCCWAEFVVRHEHTTLCEVGDHEFNDMEASHGVRRVRF
jgi:hypothetical protein